MKKTILALIMLFTTLSVSAQKIADDTTLDNGTRMVSCELKQFRSFSDKIVLWTGLSAFVTDGNIEYCLDVKLNSSKPITAPAGARILIKTTSGDVVEMSEFSNTVKEDIAGYLQNVGGVAIKTYTIGLSYKLTQENLDLILSGITKIRIELNGESNYEKEWKKDKISEFLNKEYENLTKAVASEKENSFTEDF